MFYQCAAYPKFGTLIKHVYNTCFINVPNFGYAAAMSFLIFIMVAILAFINLKVGDTRD